MVRGSSVKKGNNNWAVAVSQWAVLPQDSVQLGAHTGPTNQTACTLSVINSVVNQVNNISRMYPNPNNGNFTIELANVNSPVDVTLYDLSGRVVYTAKENTGTIHITAGQLTNGMYVVEVKEGINISRSRITVQQ